MVYKPKTDSIGGNEACWDYWDRWCRGYPTLAPHGVDFIRDKKLSMSRNSLIRR